jgi:AcrR family transcriptional regulator
MDDADRSGTEVAIMEATFEALSTYGYADLTIQRIADAFPKSKSLLYYHYDDKEAILREFLDWLVDEFRTEVERDFETTLAEDPRAALEGLVDDLLPRELSDEGRTFRVALLGLQARAAHDPVYAERFDELFASIEAALVTVIEEGIEQGEFRDVDAQQTARLVLATASGGITWTLCTGGADPGVRGALDAVLETQLYL